jgi:DNA-binding NtrC family response regulator
MIRVVLYSRDLGLYAVLASALRIDFSVGIDSSRHRVKELVTQKKCDIVLFDFESYPAREQFDFLSELSASGVPVVVLSDGDHIHGSCRKSVSPPELTSALNKAYGNHVLKPDSAPENPGASASNCGEMVGVAAASRLVYDRIRRVANLSVFVLITGESGTGKELIARAIHSASERRAHPFVAVSCGAIPESLIEAELFGCEKGAFTGAMMRRTGYFESAGEGTVLLDEIGELSLHTQVKLLRVLQQREFMRLGSSTAIPLRPRVLFATNRNLKKMVAEGSFREDLYYRVNVVGIHSQPLRERRDDIAPLAQYFLKTYSHLYGKAVTHIQPDALLLLREYAWPGNVRELENVIQSALILCDDDSLAASHLPDDLQRDSAASPGDELRWASFEEQLTDYKTKLALEAVQECNGNKTLAAQSLGISRTYLHRLIREPREDDIALRVA